MNIYPQNLRDRQHAEIIRRRAHGVRGKDNGPYGESLSSDPPPPVRGRLGRLWARDIPNLTPEQAATGLPAATMQTLSAVFGTPGMSILLTGILGMLLAHDHLITPTEAWGGIGLTTLLSSYLGAVPFARTAFRNLYRQPLQPSEVEALLQNAPEGLERAYLTLVRDAIRQKALEGSAADELRAAITALGAALDRLPVVTASPLDTDALRQEADALREEAIQGETDPVVVESLERRANALERRADAHAHSARFARRSATLRAEIETEIEALREGLIAYNAEGSTLQTAGAPLAQLSEAAQRVAAEARSVSRARAELDFHETLPTERVESERKIEQPETLRAGRR